MRISSVTVAGGDIRQCFLAEFLYMQGFYVTCLKTPAFFHSPMIRETASVKSCLSQCHCFIGPMPFSKDGKYLCQTDLSLALILECLPKGCIIAGGSIPKRFFETAKSKGFLIYDYLSFETLTTVNAALTAEGILETVLRETPFALAGTDILITGAGRCGQAAAKIFSPLCKSVTVWNRTCGTHPEISGCAYAYGDTLSKIIPTHQVIVNTVPARIFSPEMFALFSPDSYLFDIASAPGCIDQQISATLPFPSCLCPGLPGKTAPRSAAHALCRCLTDHILNPFLKG